MSPSRFRWIVSSVALSVLLLSSHAQATLVALERDTGKLYTTDPSDGSLSLIGGTGISGLNSFLGSLSAAPDGNLYSISSSPNGSFPTLYRIDPSDASATVVGQLGTGVFEGGLAITSDGTAFGVNGGTTRNSQLFGIRLDSAGVTVIGTLHPAAGGSSPLYDVNGLAFRSDGMLVGLDRPSNSLIVIDPTDASVTTLATLNPVLGGVGGLTIVGDGAYFATAGPNHPVPGSNQLFSFDPFTGDHTAIGTFAVNNVALGGGGISGLAVVPEPATLALLAAGSFLAIRRRR